jgi:small nuclear ribonucleoprotein D3
MSIGIPVKLLHEAEGHGVTIELKTGELYRGKLEESEDNMNCHLSGITYTARDGSSHPLEHAFIRGSHIRFVILPDMLKNAPMFRKELVKAGRDVGQAEDFGGGGGGRGGGRGGRGGGRGRGGGGRGMLFYSSFALFHS